MTLLDIEDEIQACQRRIEAIWLIGKGVARSEESTGNALMQVADDFANRLKILRSGISELIRGPQA